MQDSMFIGLDVHKATISVAVADGKRGGEVRSWGVIPNRADEVRKVVEKLSGRGHRVEGTPDNAKREHFKNRMMAVTAGGR